MQLNLLRRLILIWFFTSFYLAGLTQSEITPTAAELTQVLASTGQDTHRVKALLDLGGYYLFKPLELTIDLDSAMPYLQEAKKLSDQLADDAWQKESLWHLAYCYFERKDPAQAMKMAEELTSV